MRPLTKKELSLFEGIDFIHGINDCYSMIRNFYRVSFAIDLTNYARPDMWWHHGMNLYNDFIKSEGFSLIDFDKLNKLQYGDIILMAVKTEMPCPAAVYIGDGMILHHFYGRKSSIELYKGLWYNTTVSVYRHPKVKIDEETILLKAEDDDRIRNQLLLLQERARARGANI